MDGSGYPDGLVGDAIPIEARIIAVADVFDALTSVRSYRDAWSVTRALTEIDAEAGTRLDPACVAALHRVLDRERQRDSDVRRERMRRTAEPHATLAARSMAD
jgi:HD-GYP domain-containing protein (c-di-GMP phosphodiesterase class II)